MYPHRIRLLGPWDCEPLSPPLPACRFVPPGRLRDAGLADYSGRVRLVRRFGFPGRIDAYEHVWLTVADLAGRAAVALNDRTLGSDLRGSFEFEIGALLASRNRLEILLHADSGDAGLTGEIALEIRRDAFLHAILAKYCDGKVRASGLVVGQTVQPLELYVLADGQHVAYSLTEARPVGHPFQLTFQTETAPTSIHIELVCVAECWYAADVPVMA
jgi:hypothetical protein